MKSIYKVILSIGISILSHSVFALDAPAALVPAGLNPGDQFYVMFKSTTPIAGNLTVNEYNNLVNTDADAQNIGPASGLTWSAFMNHVDLDLGAETATEQTLSLFGANTAAPIYTTAGAQISVNRAGLFDGAIDTAIRYEADGVTGVTNTVWTGSFAAGDANLPLGTGSNTLTTEGVASAVDNRWIDDTLPFDKTFTNARIYAVSPLLVVPVIAPTAGNDVATVAASDGGGGGGMDWSLLVFFSVLSLLRAKIRQ